MPAQPGFPRMEAKCGSLEGKPGVPDDVLGEQLPGASTKLGKDPNWKKAGCTTVAAPEGAKPAAH